MNSVQKWNIAQTERRPTDQLFMQMTVWNYVSDRVWCHVPLSNAGSLATLLILGTWCELHSLSGTPIPCNIDNLRWVALWFGTGLAAAVSVHAGQANRIIDWIQLSCMESSPAQDLGPSLAGWSLNTCRPGQLEISIESISHAQRVIWFISSGSFTQAWLYAVLLHAGQGNEIFIVTYFMQWTFIISGFLVLVKVWLYAVLLHAGQGNEIFIVIYFMQWTFIISGFLVLVKVWLYAVLLHAGQGNEIFIVIYFMQWTFIISGFLVLVKVWLYAVLLHAGQGNEIFIVISFHA